MDENIYDEKGVANLVAEVALRCPKLICARYGTEQPQVRPRNFRHTSVDERQPCEEGCLVNLWSENGCGPKMIAVVRANRKRFEIR